MTLKKENFINFNNSIDSSNTIPVSTEFSSMFLKFLDDNSKNLEKRRLNFNARMSKFSSNKFKKKKTVPSNLFRNYKRFFPY